MAVDLEELQRQIEDVRVMAEDALDKFPLRSTTTAGAARERHIHDLGKHPGGVIATRVFNSANISIPNSTLTTLTFNSERYDTGDIHSTSSSTGRLTAKTAGKQIIAFCGSFAANATGRRQIQFRFNGSTIIAVQEWDTNQSSANTVMALSTQYDFAVDDYVECLVFQNSGGALNIEAVSNYSPEFMMARIGAAGTSGGGAPGTDHGGLTGLSDDDHSLYLLEAGTRALTGDWDVGAFKITANGFRLNDNENLTLGTGADATIDYDGTDLIIQPAVVGAGDLVISGASIEFDDNEGVTLGTGKDVTLQYDGTHLILEPNTARLGNSAVGSIHMNTDFAGGASNANFAGGSTSGTGLALVPDTPSIIASPVAGRVNIKALLLSDNFIYSSANAVIIEVLTAGPTLKVTGDLRFAGDNKIEDSDGVDAIGFEALASRTTLGHAIIMINSGELSINTGANPAASLDVQEPDDAASNRVGIFRSGNRATPANDDEGYVSLYNDDSTGTQVEFSRFTWKALDVTNTTKDAQFEFAVHKNNALTDCLLLGALTTTLTADNIVLEGAVVINEAGADVDFRIEGDTDANLFVVDAGTDRVGVGTTTPVNRLEVTGGSGAEQGIACESDGSSQFFARSTTHTDREMRFQVFSDGITYFGPSVKSGSVAAHLVIRAAADGGATNTGEVRLQTGNTTRFLIETGGDIRVINSMLIGANSAPTSGFVLDVRGSIRVTETMTLIAATALTVATGAVTATKSFHTITSESGTTDDLTDINGDLAGDIIVIEATATHTITAKDGTGNMLLGADVTLVGDNGDTLTMISDGTNWRRIAAATN